MALDLGELSGRIGMDIKPLKRDLAEGKSALDGHVSDAKQAGAEAGSGFGSEWGDKAKDAAKLGAVAVVGAMVYGINQGLEREASGDKLAAQLGLSPRQQSRAGAVAGRLYANAYGGSIGEVNDALAATMTSFDGMTTGHRRQLRNLTKQALDYGTAFEVDVARGIQVAGQLVNTGLADNAGEAFDLITTGSQRVPAAVREDLLDAADEYGQFFATLGYSGQQAFSLLVDASEKGMYGIDKAGDAIKEFTIRSTDMSTLTRDAYKALGFDTREMTNDLLAGGDTAQEATQKIIDGILKIKDPAKQAQTAIALFGTPLEDLNTAEIPDFIRSLQGGSDAMKGFKGSAKDMGDTLNDNASAKVTAFKRKMEGELIEFLAEDAIPFIEDDVIPTLGKIGDALDTVPSWAIKGSVGGFFGLLAAGKLGSLVGNLRGLRGLGKGGGTGGVLGTVSKAAPIPVFVTNQGFGVPGTGVDVPGGTKGGRLAGAARTVGTYALPVAALGASLKGVDDLLDDAASRRDPDTKNYDYNALGYSNDIYLDMTQKMDSAAGDMLKTAVTAGAQVAKALSVLPPELVTSFGVDGIPESESKVRALVKEYDLTPKEKKTLFELTGYDPLMARIRNINTQLDYASRDRRTQITIAYSNAGYETAGGIPEGSSNDSSHSPKARGRTVTPRMAGGVGVMEREVLPKQVNATIDGLGEIVIRFMREEIEDNDVWRESLGGRG